MALLTEKTLSEYTQYCDILASSPVAWSITEESGVSGYWLQTATDDDTKERILRVYRFQNEVSYRVNEQYFRALLYRHNPTLKKREFLIDQFSLSHR